MTLGLLSEIGPQVQPKRTLKDLEGVNIEKGPHSWDLVTSIWVSTFFFLLVILSERQY
jgi:hypothetical protein